MIGRLAALAALVFALSGVPHQTADTVSIYVDDPSAGAVGEYGLAIDGQPVPLISVTPGPQPLSAIVLQDVSDSMRRRSARDTARGLAGVVRPEDAVRLGTFADKILFSAAPVTDRPSADSAAREVDQSGGASPLWEGVAQSIDALRSAGGERAVIVFSDGMATADDRGFDDADDLAVRSAVVFAVVGVADAALPGPSQMRVIGRNEGLQRLARDTGGVYRELRTPGGDPVRLMTTLLQELRGRTRMEFVAPLHDRAVHRVEVTRHGRPVGSRALRVF